MSKGLVWDGGFSWYWGPLASLLEYIEPDAVFLLQEMDACPLRRHPGPPDALVCGPHQSDGDPTLDVPACPSVGLPPLCCYVNV